MNNENFTTTETLEKAIINRKEFVGKPSFNRISIVEDLFNRNRINLNLEIDPNFYFQNNTFGAEELYKAVMELAGVDEETTVLDLCCDS
ncbi:hypothetical protein J6590_044884 [Homalodisca vitripennis]|nr:hypothetical protein J6590_044884 [Homalodisca vitripennis]